MIGARTDGWKWAQASGLSVALHAAVLGYLIYQPSFDFLTAKPAVPLAPLEIITLAPEPAPEVPDVPTETLPEVTQTSPAAEIPEPQLIAPSTLPELPPVAADPITPTESEVVTPATDPEQAADPSSLPTSIATEAEAPDPRMLELIERIRGRLTEPCMLALPLMRGEDALQLNVISDSDRNITALMDALTDGIEGDIAREAVLLDQRQCAAVAFARRDPRYPVYALGMQLSAQQVARGGVLSGQISIAPGYYQSLLLVDENGVVHDMRRSLIPSARAARFEFNIARWRQPRDTHQLLIALATRERPATIATMSGELAGPFFDALFAEVGQNALIGISSFYVQ